MNVSNLPVSWRVLDVFYEHIQALSSGDFSTEMEYIPSARAHDIWI